MEKIVKIEKVITVETTEGEGTDSDPYRNVKRIYNFEGELLNVIDPYTKADSLVTSYVVIGERCW